MEALHVFHAKMNPSLPLQPTTLSQVTVSAFYQLNGSPTPGRHDKYPPFVRAVWGWSHGHKSAKFISLAAWRQSGGFVSRFHAGGQACCIVLIATSPSSPADCTTNGFSKRRRRRRRHGVTNDGACASVFCSSSHRRRANFPSTSAPRRHDAAGAKHAETRARRKRGICHQRSARVQLSSGRVRAAGTPCSFFRVEFVQNQIAIPSACELSQSC